MRNSFEPVLRHKEVSPTAQRAMAFHIPDSIGPGTKLSMAFVYTESRASNLEVKLIITKPLHVFGTMSRRSMRILEPSVQVKLVCVGDVPFTAFGIAGRHNMSGAMLEYHGELYSTSEKHLERCARPTVEVLSHLWNGTANALSLAEVARQVPQPDDEYTIKELLIVSRSFKVVNTDGLSMILRSELMLDRLKTYDDSG